MVGWSCRYRGCNYGFDVVCIYMFVCFSLNICNDMRIRIGCMYVVARFNLCMISFSVFVCWDMLGCGVLGYYIFVVEKVVDFFFFFSCMILF